MNVLRRHWPLLAAASLVVLAGCGGGAGGGGTLAIVNGERIPVSLFHDYLETKQQVQVSLTAQLITGIAQAAEKKQLSALVNQQVPLPVYNTLAFQALDDLINQTILLQLAKDEKVLPTDDEVEKEIGFRKALNPNFITERTSAGINIRQIRRQVLVELAQEKLLTKGITVNDSEADQYIEQHKVDQFTDPATVTLRWILIDGARKDEVDKALGSGTDFATVAARYSRAQGAEQTQGRFLGRDSVPLEGLSPDVRRVVGPMVDKDQKGATTWIKSDAGQDVYAKFYVEGSTKAKPKTITAEIKEQVRRAIAKDRGKAANDLDKRLADRLQQYIKEDKIQVPYENLKDPWKRISQALKTRLSTAGTGTGANTGIPSTGTGSSTPAPTTPAPSAGSKTGSTK